MSLGTERRVSPRKSTPAPRAHAVDKGYAAPPPLIHVDMVRSLVTDSVELVINESDDDYDVIIKNTPEKCQTPSSINRKRKVTQSIKNEVCICSTMTL